MKQRLDAIRAAGNKRGGGRPPVWAAIGLTLLLAAAAIVGVLSLSASLDEKRDAASLAQEISVLVNSVYGSHAATIGSTPGSELRAAAAIVHLDSAVVALGELDSSTETQNLITAFGLLKQIVLDNEQGILTGQLTAPQAEAAAIEGNRAVIEAAVVASSSIRQSAVTTERLFQVLIIGLFVLAGASVVGLVLSANSQRKSARSERAQLENRFRAMLQNGGDVISLLDRNGNVQAQTSSMLRLLGRSDFWLTGRAFGEIVHLDERPQLNELIQRAIQHPGETVQNRLRLSHGDGSYRWFEVLAVDLLNQSEVDGVLLTCRLEDEANRVAPAKALAGPTLVQHPVSRLLSEPFFRDRLQHALVRSARKDEPVSLLVIDLGPKEALNSLSDDARAAVLRTIAGRIARSIRGEDSAAHLDGYELAIVLEDADIDRARNVASRVTEQIQTPVSHLNGQVKLSAHIGIAVKSDPRDNVETMLLDARASLRGSVATVNVESQHHERKDIDVVVSVVATNGSTPKPDSFAALAVSGGSLNERIAIALKSEPPAIEQRPIEVTDDRVFDPAQFEIQFLPVLALQTGEIVEIEAVARWRQPHRGLVAIEASGMADFVTPWVFERACVVARSLPPTRSGRRVRVSMNITSATPLDEVLVDGVAGVLLTTGVDPAGIQLEIPVRMLDEDDPTYETAISVVKQLRDLGICLAIDGTGADIDRLPDIANIPVSAVKIDRSVVSLLDRSADRRALVREIVERAQPFNVSVTGTGVETLEQAERLWDLGADQGQGPLFFRLVTEEQLHALFTTEGAMAAAD